MTSGDNPFVHEKGIVEQGATLGLRTRVWAFAHVLGRARIGSDCNICDHVFIENDVVVGNRVTVKCGVQLWDGLRIDDDCFIGPNATFTNDLYPRSKRYPEKFSQTVLKKGCSIGANATIIAGITIGEYSLVAAGAVVTRSVLPYSIVKGNPARSAGWICSCGQKLDTQVASAIACACGRRFLISSGSLISA